MNSWCGSKQGGLWYSVELSKPAVGAWQQDQSLERVGVQPLSHSSSPHRPTALVDPYLQCVDRESADGREVQDLEVVHVAVHDDSRQVEAAGGGGHADLAELVVQELAHDGTLAHASSPQHSHPVGGDHASHPTPPPPRPRRCLGLPRAAYSRDCGLSHRQDQPLLPLLTLGPLWPPPGLGGQEVDLVDCLFPECPALLHLRAFAEAVSATQNVYPCPEPLSHLSKTSPSLLLHFFAAYVERTEGIGLS